MAPVNPASGSGGVDYGNTVFTDKKTTDVTADDFLKLMVAQLQNQDFMNPVDDTQYIAQLAQFATMQQMSDLASFSKQNYVMSLVGQTVTAARFKVNGEIESVTGQISKISLIEDEYLVYIGDKSFTLDQIMELGGKDPSKPGDDNTNYDQSNFLLSLIGQKVTVKNGEGNDVEGMVERISIKDGMKLMVDGAWYTLDQLESVDKPGGETPPTDETDKTE